MLKKYFEMGLGIAAIVSTTSLIYQAIELKRDINHLLNDVKNVRKTVQGFEDAIVYIAENIETSNQPEIAKNLERILGRPIRKNEEPIQIELRKYAE